MKLNLSYGTGVLVLPASVLSHLPPDSAYLHVLLILAAVPALRDNAEDAVNAIAGTAGLPADTVRNALSYWGAHGILVPAEEETAELPPRIRPASEERRQAEALREAEVLRQTEALRQTAESVNKAEEPVIQAETAVKQAEEASASAAAPSAEPVKRQSQLPVYTQAQTAELISSDPGLRSTLDACQQAVGKIFTERESEQIAALYDSYGLDGEYLLMLFALCRKRGKTSVSYAVRTALGMYDDGVRTSAELNAKIAQLDRLSESSYQIRTMFGIGERALSPDEMKYIETWTETWKMPMDVIRCAYDICIKYKDKPVKSYIDKILSRWNELGIRTVDAVREAEEQFAASRAQTEEQNAPSSPKPAKKKADDTAFSTFDTDEFLELAMKRTFGGQ